MWGYLLLLLSLQKRCYFSTFFRRAKVCAKRAQGARHMRWEGRTKKAHFSILPRFAQSRLSRAPRPFVLNSCEKKRLFCRLLYFQNLWTKSYDVSTSSESSLRELLHITIYLCFKISEQTWIWFFCQFFLWSLLLSSDRVTRFLNLNP